MAKKKEPLSPVHCRQCSYATGFIENSCFCKIRSHRVCACGRYGRICEKFKKK
nr:MAG TPA: Ribosome biosynthesis protein [Caudoviricetes sp.]